MNRMIEPMEVEVVSDDQGTHIEPSLDRDWDEHTQLSWQAGVVKARTGHKVMVARSQGIINSQPTYSLSYQSKEVSSSHGAYFFMQAWAWLSAFEAGVLYERGVTDGR